MNVVTVTPASFLEVCAHLEAIASPYAPDLIVGIARGGEKVARCMFADVPHVSVTSQRADTAAKSSLAPLLGRLPRPVTNVLRICESRLRRLRRAEPRPYSPTPEVTEAVRKASRILVVDDAIDSGATIAGVVDALRAIGGDAEIRTAVLTVTTPRPLLRPDYTLYLLTLLRLPGAPDA